MDSKQQIETHILNYYSNLFDASNDHNLINVHNFVDSHVSHMVTAAEMIVLLLALLMMRLRMQFLTSMSIVSLIQTVLGGCFHQTYRGIVGDDVCKATKKFFSQNWILPSMNSILFHSALHWNVQMAGI